MVNVNIGIPDDLHKRLKIAAITADRTLKDHIIARLEQRLQEEKR